MPQYRVELKPSVARQLVQLQPRDLRRVARAIDALALEPRPPGVDKLKGTDDYWRIRVDDFRIVYTIADQRLLVLVVRVGHRRDVYR